MCSNGYHFWIFGQGICHCGQCHCAPHMGSCGTCDECSRLRNGEEEEGRADRNNFLGQRIMGALFLMDFKGELRRGVRRNSGAVVFLWISIGFSVAVC